MNHLVEIFSEKFAQMEKDKDALIDQLAEMNKKQTETIKEQTETNKKLKEEIALLKSVGARARKSRDVIHN